MKWYGPYIHTMVSSLVFYTFAYFMFGMVISCTHVSDIPFDTSYANTIVNYFIPMNI